MLSFVWQILLLAVAVFIVSKALPGIRLKSFTTAIGVALVYSIIDFLLFKILLFLSLPLVFLSLGIFIFFINAALLWLTDKLIDDFEISGLGTTLIASFFISISNMLLQWIF